MALIFAATVVVFVPALPWAVSQSGLDGRPASPPRCCCWALPPSAPESSSARRSASPTSSTTWCWATRSWPTRWHELAPARTAISKAASGPRPTSADKYPQVLRPTGGSTRRRCLGCRQAERVALGGVLFQYHCNDCHAIGLGYSAARPAGAGLDARHAAGAWSATSTGCISRCRPGRARPRRPSWWPSICRALPRRSRRDAAGGEAP